MTSLMTDESRLVERLCAIEALFAGATTDGERDAADRARQRIVARLAELPRTHPSSFKFQRATFGPAASSSPCFDVTA
jgi:hypothetical protein